MTRPVDPALILALHTHLSEHARGRANAVTWDDLLHIFNAYPYSLDVRAVRRLQEARDALVAQGCPIVGLSSRGVFLAETVEELDEAIAESRRRALRSLAGHSRLKRLRLSMMGQGVLGGVA